MAGNRSVASSLRQACAVKALNIDVQVRRISHIEEPLTSEGRCEPRLALQKLVERMMHFVLSIQISQSRYAVGERPIVAIRDANGFQCPLLSLLELFCKQMCECPL